MNIRSLEYRKKVILLIVITTAIRLLLSSLVELNNDEVYYWTYAKHLQWNYFDHPPMVAACIRFFTAGLRWNHEFFIRLTSVVASAIGTWLIFLTGRKLKDAYTGWIAACLFTASFYSSVIAGLLILPDSPQLVFWLLSVYLMVDIVKSESATAVSKRLLLLGVVSGFCILSKVHGAFCWLGFGAYIVFHKRALLRNPFLYLSLLLTVTMLIPSLMWLLNSHMSTYDYHSSRINFQHIQPDSFFRELFGSFLYNNPVNVVLLIIVLIFFIKKRGSLTDPAYTLLLWLGLPLILIVLFLSIFNDTLPHWSGPAYTTLILITAIDISRRSALFVKRIVTYAISVTGVALIIAIGIINYWPGTTGEKTMPDYGENDITLDMCGWRAFGADFKQFYQKDLQINKDTARYIFSNYWFPAGHLDFYVARPMGINVKAIGPLHAIHHFAWLNALLLPLENGASAYYITISNFYAPPPAELVKQFKTVSAPALIPQWRSGKIARYFYIYRLTGYNYSP